MSKLTIIVIVLVTVLVTLSLVSAENPPTGWTYSSPLYVKENSGTDLVNYQVRFVINTQTPIENDQMHVSGDDIRFGYNDGATLLNYWIENGINSISTVIWVKIDNLHANEKKTIYMYYGNSKVSGQPASSIPSTFLGTYSATNKISGGTLSSAQNSQRGFRFSPKNTDVLVVSFGKNTPNNTARNITLFNFQTQAIVEQILVSGQAGTYNYTELCTPLWLTNGTQYLVEVYQNLVDDSYYFQQSSQINSHLTYYDMRYCNGCAATTFPQDVLNNYQYGYPDFMFYVRTELVAPEPTTYASQTYASSSPRRVQRPMRFTASVAIDPTVV